MHKQLKVFYHLYIPDSIFCINWPLWIDQQLGLLIKSKLADNAQVYMTITMPKFWDRIDHWRFKRNSSNSSAIEYDYCLFFEKVIEYISTRYSFVSIIDIRDTGDTNLYEGQCLRYLYAASQEEQAYYLYFHSKGISTPTMVPTHSWREVLNHYMITEWKTCIKLLENHDVVYVLDASYKHNIQNNIPITPSGNFWWANSSYIRKLKEPLDSTAYIKDAPHHPNHETYRYAFERWISTGFPKIGVMINTNTIHYDNYCFLEQLNKQQQKPYTINTFIK